MLDCIIIGDSIADGISHFRRDCMAITQVGITSQSFLEKYSTILPTSNTAIISLGSNDPNNPKLNETLLTIRERMSSDYVIWILPNENLFPRAYKIIDDIAAQFNDGTIRIKNQFLSPDKIHPTSKGYKNIADFTNNNID